jgi:hypothetical protein
MDDAPRFYTDLSFWILLFSNSVTIGYAVVEVWPLTTIMIVYWVQSIIIGSFNVVRILSLKTFSTEGFYVDGRSVQPTEKTKKSTASFFGLHYGFFHFIYGVFLLQDLTGVNLQYVLFGGFIFFVDHLFSFKYNQKRDERKIQNIGRLMFFPYARIIPMHLVILASGVFASGTASLFLFLVLKTAADVVMHIVEHW